MKSALAGPRPKVRNSVPHHSAVMTQGGKGVHLRNYLIRSTSHPSSEGSRLSIGTNTLSFLPHSA